MLHNENSCKAYPLDKQKIMQLSMLLAERGDSIGMSDALD